MEIVTKNLFNQLKENKLFWFGLFLKIIAITILAPEIQKKWSKGQDPKFPKAARLGTLSPGLQYSSSG